ncbi:MAG TPA: HAD hydrolase-like protein [Fimbriimonadaceae bacterium]|nr:HAD hydrolase-like protein [Fimbriimonadaceae bacterium]
MAEAFGRSATRRWWSVRRDGLRETNCIDIHRNEIIGDPPGEIKGAHRAKREYRRYLPYSIVMPQGFSLANFEAVLFDVDGTLVDSLEMIIPGLGDAIEKFAGVRPSDEEIKSIVGLPMRTQFERYLGKSPSDDQLDEMIDYSIARFEAYVDRETVFEPAVAVMRLCKSMDMATSLVTSKSAKELALFMKRFSGAEAVDATVCASEVRHPKPAPDSALLAVEKLRVTPGQAVLIGDSIYDLRCARAAGIANVAVGYGAATSDALLAEAPDLFIETPEALLDWAQRSFSNQHAPQERTEHRIIDPDDSARSAGAA